MSLLLLLQGSKTTCYKERHLVYRLHQKWEEMMEGMRKGRWEGTGESLTECPLPSLSVQLHGHPGRGGRSVAVPCPHRSSSLRVPPHLSLPMTTASRVLWDSPPLGGTF